MTECPRCILEEQEKIQQLFFHESMSAYTCIRHGLIQAHEVERLQKEINA